jgi:hypothetical protein
VYVILSATLPPLCLCLLAGGFVVLIQLDGEDLVRIRKPLRLIDPSTSDRQRAARFSAAEDEPGIDKICPLAADLASWAAVQVEAL